jgi:hypothetical protein
MRYHARWEHRARKLLKRHGIVEGEDGLCYPRWAMHRKTFDRIIAEVQELNDAAFAARLPRSFYHCLGAPHPLDRMNYPRSWRQ